MLYMPAKVWKTDDYDAVRRGGAGDGTIAPSGDQFRDGSLLLPDTGGHEFRSVKLWDMSAVMSSGDICLCDQV